MTTTSPRPADFEGFVHADGGRLLDGRGRELLLRGVGMGNWLLPEGYMWRFGPGAESPREIEALIARLVGEDAAERFWADFRDAFFTEADVAAIAALGFDHIRLPINSRVVMDEHGTLLEHGFELIDRVIDWCRTHRLWVLLDLHGAPGGQTGTNIDDSPRGLPELFMHAHFRAQTVSLWTAIAQRYASETVVLGYDLLNEPIPNEWQHVYADGLAALYRELTAAIRTVDRDHLIVYEGSHWATNWGLFTEVWDANSMLQFHKYWSPPDVASISRFLETRDRLGLPIYMGEGGENNLGWLYCAFRLYESQGIGWNLWPWKKLETVTSPVSITAPEGWDTIRDGSADRATAERALAEFVKNAKWENCIARDEVVRAVTALQPAYLPAWAFAFRGDGVAVREGTTLSTMRRDDRVSIEYLRPRSEEWNVFEHTDGREPTEEETLVVRLAAGDQIDFDGDLEPDRYRALAPDGSAAPVVLASNPGGLSVTATADCVLWRLQRVDDADARPPLAAYAVVPG